MINKLSPVRLSQDLILSNLFYLTAYSISLMHGLMLSIWRHFPLAPFEADMFLVDTVFKLLMHWNWDNDCDDDRQWRLSQLDRMNWSRVATVNEQTCVRIERVKNIFEREWCELMLFTKLKRWCMLRMSWLGLHNFREKKSKKPCNEKQILTKIERHKILFCQLHHVHCDLRDHFDLHLSPWEH